MSPISALLFLLISCCWSRFSLWLTPHVRIHVLPLGISSLPFLDMFSILQSLLGKISFSFDFDIQRFWDIRHHDVNQLAHAKHKMLENDHKSKLECQNVPVDWSEVSLLITESFVVTFRLQLDTKLVTVQQVENAHPALLYPVSFWRLRQCEPDIAIHFTFAIVESVDKLLNEVTGKSNQECLQDNFVVVE